MADRKHLWHFVMTAVLVIGFMLPTSVQFFHSFESHDHVPCTETKTHIHQDASNCEICDFHLASFSYEIASYPNLGNTPVPGILQEQITSLLFHSYTITNTQLRAPPVS